MRACAACGRPVDALRAPIVAILDGHFAYFCSPECKRSTTAVSLAPPAVAPRDSANASAIVGAAELAREVDALRAATAATTTTAARAETSRPQREDPELAHAALELDRQAPRPASRRSPDEDLRAKGPTSAPAPSSSSLPPAPSSSLPPPASAPESRRSGRPSRSPAARSSIAAPPFVEGAARIGALVAAVLGVALGLVDSGRGALRLLLATGSCVLLLALLVLVRARTRRARPLDAAIEAKLGAPLGSAIVAAVAAVALGWGARMIDPASATTAIGAAIWIVLAACLAEAVSHASARAVLAEAHTLVASLEPAAARDEARHVGDVLELRAGHLLLEDVRVVTGLVVVDPWENPAFRGRRCEGEPIAAGAVVREGTATARVVAVGRDRAFARFLGDALERASHASPRLRIADRVAPLAAIAIAAASIALGVLGSGHVGSLLVAGVAAALSILVPPARRLAVRDHLAGVVEACRRGAAFRDADAFAQAASVRTAIFCLRGTLVAAAPDSCDVEPIGANVAADVIALAAGAELGLQHPVALAIVRGAQARSARPIDVRSVAFEPGLGVRGELASGAAVLVGSRALCLRAHVPTAEHEARITELEATGRDVVIVARDHKAIGLITLQSPLRGGSLASVQRLHDLEVDPVILGGATRGRLEAIGRAVDVEHVRPELLTRERAAEVKRIAQSAGPVAVIGRPSFDAAALGAADLAIALADAGDGPDAPAVALAHDQLVHAVDVLALAQATRARISATLSVGFAPVAIAALPVAFGLIRPMYAPLAALAATIALGVRDLVAAALPEGGRMDDN